MTAACILIPCYRGGILDFTYLGDASLYHIFSCHARCRRLDKNLKIVSNIPIWVFFFFVHCYYINWQRHAFSIKYVTHLDNISHRVSKNNVVIS